MKTLHRIVLCAAFYGSLLFPLLTSAAEKSDKQGKVPVGSIRPAGKIKSKDLPALAKISFDAAKAAALAEVPGDVIKAELEVEDGNLQYSFEIVGSDKSVTEIEVDAGNGKILDKDKEVDD